MNIYVVGGDKHYASFIKKANLVDNIKDADIVLFTGGEDVDPSLYADNKFYKTYSDLQRDFEEKKVFRQITKKQLALGICRGSQFLCVMNGGKLVQDCTGHALLETHPITNGKIEYDITSTHHQMQYPYNLENYKYKVLYKSATNRSNYYVGSYVSEETIKRCGEPEIVLYTNPELPKCLAIQGHPEYMRKDAPVVKMLNTLINKILKDIKNENN